MSKQSTSVSKRTSVVRETVLISVRQQEMQVAILQGNRLCEFLVEREKTPSLVGNIYMGRITRVLPGMQSAFVDIGIDRTAFLNFSDCKNLAPGQRRIENLLTVGQALLTQVSKEPIGSKGARLNTEFSLPGRYLVFFPQGEKISVSRRIEDPEKRKELKSLLQSLLPTEFTGGCIVRTHACNVNPQALQADLNSLLQQWKRIQEKVKGKEAPALIIRDLSLPFRFLRDEFNESIEQIWVDCQHTALALQEFSDRYDIKAAPKIHYFKPRKGSNLFGCYQVDEQVNQALRSRVNLERGGYLIIESTESMTTIDVNTGAFTGDSHVLQTVFQTNLRACQVIAWQLQLRNIGGMIMVDFIDMPSDTHQQKVLAELAYWLRQDKIKVTLHGMTALGLVELTRVRKHRSLSQIFSTICPHCGGVKKSYPSRCVREIGDN